MRTLTLALLLAIATTMGATAALAFDGPTLPANYTGPACVVAAGRCVRLAPSVCPGTWVRGECRPWGAR